MKILSIDTSCDETAAAVTEGTKVLSNVVWSQASLHAKWGGIVPSLAQRMHKERIDFVVQKALANCKLKIENCDCVAVTVGPGLSIALGVGVDKARELAKKYKKKLIAVNHVEAHLLSPLANSRFQILDSSFPAYGLCVSGGNTIFVLIEKIGRYEILAQTVDDALGEALDKGARMLGLGYPGGAILEKFARLGDPKAYTLPIPILGQEKRKIFTYSGLKTAMYRLAENQKPLTKEKIQNLAATFQDTAFKHLIRVISHIIKNLDFKPTDFLIGGGVAANVEVRKRLRKLSKEFGIKALFPYSNRLYGDNAAMIGIAAYFKAQRGEFIDPDKIDRNPRLRL